MKILVTGAAGFIGYHLCERLIADGYSVVGLDNLNHYYDVRLKLDRLKELGINPYEIAMGKTMIESNLSSFRFTKQDIKDQSTLLSLFKDETFDLVFHLAAQAGVRYSIERPDTYVDSNLVGFANILQACRIHTIKHLVYASSSSVYGNTKETPFSTNARVDKPVSFYAATKKCNELMAYSYSHLFDLTMTGLRFFTVYGEWGRPDMAAMIFAKAMLEGKPIKVFNEGNMSRDFTYVGDIIEGLVKIKDRHKTLSNNDDESSTEKHKIYNIGNSKPVNLLSFITSIEKNLGVTSIKKMYPMQAGDVQQTYADVSPLKKEFDYKPNTNLDIGIEKFCTWYKEYYSF